MNLAKVFLEDFIVNKFIFVISPKHLTISETKMESNMGSVKTSRWNIALDFQATVAPYKIDQSDRILAHQLQKCTKLR